MSRGSIFNGGGAPSSVRALSSRLVPGRCVALKYDEDTWHEAVLVAPSKDMGSTAVGWTWEVLTPDGDRYDEALDGSDPGCVSCMVLDDFPKHPILKKTKSA